MIVTFWGVRGSVPSPGRLTCRYGGNTSCVSVEAGDRVLVLDAGTGIVPLGETLAASGKEVFILLSHLHADHLMGFPFFAPLYCAAERLHLLSYEKDGRPWSLMNLLDGCHFPVEASDLTVQPHCVEADPLGFLRTCGFEVRRHAVNHPGGAFGYRVSHGGRTLVFVPDNELDPPGAATVGFAELAAFCRDADVLVHDAQYLPSDLPMKWGWGHSTLGRACALAAEAQVRHFVPFHHDPCRSDAALDAMQAEARDVLTPKGIACTFAYEGLRLEL